jgi:thioredoxin reductase (NADPH)
VVVFAHGPVLVDPSNAEVATALGVRTQPAAGTYDLVILGAGPAGLSAAVYGASEGLRTVLVEPAATGGQAGTSSLIRNYLGFAQGVSGRRLARSASQQALLFGTEFVYNEARSLTARGRDRVVTLADGGEVVGRAVVVACGARYRRLGVPALEALLGAGVFYGAAVPEARAMQGGDVFVVGAGNSAGQAALHLARFARRVTVLVRGETPAATMSDYLARELAASPNVAVRVRARAVGGGGAGRLERLVLEERPEGLVGDGTPAGTRETVAADGLFILIGAEPNTAWLDGILERDERGYLLTGRDLVRDGTAPRTWPLEREPLLLETSIPGVFAAGDVRHRSIKRVAAAVGEGSIATQLVHEYLQH